MRKDEVKQAKTCNQVARKEAIEEGSHHEGEPPIGLAPTCPLMVGAAPCVLSTPHSQYLVKFKKECKKGAKTRKD